MSCTLAAANPRAVQVTADTSYDPHWAPAGWFLPQSAEDEFYAPLAERFEPGGFGQPEVSEEPEVSLLQSTFPDLNKLGRRKQLLR